MNDPAPHAVKGSVLTRDPSRGRGVFAARFLAAVAWRNLWRHKRRSLITAVAMAVAVAMCMASIALTDGLYAQMFEVMVEQQLGHVQVHHPDYPGKRVMYDTLPDAGALVATLDDVEGTAAVSPRMNGFALVGGDADSAGAQLVGVDAGREAAVSPIVDRVNVGAFLTPGGDHEIVLGKGLAEEIEAGVGDTVVAVTQAADGSVGNDLYEVVGIYKSGNAMMDRAGAYMHLDDLQELLVLPDQVHQVTLLADDPDDIDAFASRVKARVSSDTIEAQAWYEASPETAQMMSMRDVSAFIVLGIVFVVAAFGVLNTMMMSVFERTRELGVLKALGLRPGRMVQLILFESAFLATLASSIGLVLGGAADAFLVLKGFDMSSGGEDGFSFAGIMINPVVHGQVRPMGVVLVVGAVFVVSLLSSLFPAWRAASLQPVEAIRTE